MLSIERTVQTQEKPNKFPKDDMGYSFLEETVEFCIFKAW
jgi:hypothetical protein